MDEKQEFKDTLEQLEKSNRQQARFAKLQCLFSLIAALCCAGVLYLVWSLMPQITLIGDQAEVTIADLQTTLSNLEVITNQLAEADLGGMANNVDSLVTTSQASVEQITERLNAIDFDTLNKAIQHLSDVVEPLAKFFNVFNR